MPKGDCNNLSPFGISAFSFLPILNSGLKGEAQLHTDEPAVVDSLLVEACPNAPEIHIGFNIRDREEPARCLVNVKGEGAELGEILIVWRAERMVENVVEVRADLQPHRLTELEKLADTKVHSPRTGSGERITPGQIGVVQGIGADGRR